MPCFGAEAENCSNRARVQEGEAAAPFLALLFSSPTSAEIMYIFFIAMSGEMMLVLGCRCSYLSLSSTWQVHFSEFP